MVHLITQLIGQLFDPPHCALCNIFLSQRQLWCHSCAQQLRPVVSTTLSISAAHQMPVFAAAAYAEPIKQLIISKWWSQRVASWQLGDLIWQRTPVSILEFDYIVPVPLHWRRYAWRGYNQAQIIAQIISKQSGKPVVKLVKRVTATEQQSSVSVEMRDKNVRDAFIFCGDKEQYRGASFLIVDDLMTTGATLKWVAKNVVDSCHPQKINAVVAARTV